MRITGGQIKGRKLSTFKGMHIRPTSDRTREALFSIIGQDLSRLKVLDLFAGTGSLGIEALSRNAQHAVFIDNSQKAIHLITKNLMACGFQDMGTVLKKNLKKGLALHHPEVPRHFDLVFLDPPYGKDLIKPLLGKLSISNILSNRSRVVVELSKHEKLPNSFGTLEMTDSRQYGDTKIDFYVYEATS